MIEVSLWRDPIVLRLREMDSRLGKIEAADEVGSISDAEPRDRVGVMVAEFRIVSEAEEPEKPMELPAVSESPEKLAIES